MRNLDTNWPRSIAGFLAIVLLTLTFAPVAFAYASVHDGENKRAGMSVETSSHAPARSTDDAGSHHTNDNVCYGSTCYYFLAALKLSKPAAFVLLEFSPVLSDLRFGTLQANLYRPPRTRL